MIKFIDLLKEQGKINNTLLVNYLGQLMSKYKTADEFKIDNPKAWQKAKELGILKSLFKDEFHRNIKWTPDTIKKAAAPYKSRGEFQIKNVNAYAAARSRDMLDDLFPQKLSGGFKGGPRWTPDEIKKAAAPYKSRGEFSSNNKAAYAAALRNNMIDDLFPDTLVFKWTPDAIKKAAAPYKSRGEFQAKNVNAYAAARSRGMLDDLFPPHAPIPGGEVVSSLPDVIKKRAARVKNRREFASKYPETYLAASRYDMLDDLFPNDKK